MVSTTSAFWSRGDSDSLLDVLLDICRVADGAASDHSNVLDAPRADDIAAADQGLARSR